jgi:hypothetical protein
LVRVEPRSPFSLSQNTRKAARAAPNVRLWSLVSAACRSANACALSRPEHQPRHLPVAYVNESCHVRSHVFQLQPAQLAVPAVVAEHKDPLAVKLTVLVRSVEISAHARKNSRHASAIAATP